MIPSLLVKDKIISKFYEKTNLFNKFFTSQCTHFENNSSLRPFCLKARKSLLPLEISETDIFAILKNLDPNKSHDWDIKLCGKSITYPFKIILKHRYKREHFQVVAKKLSCASAQNAK